MILADAYDVFLVDLDGVVWRGEQTVPGSEAAIAAVRARGARVVFVTNNSSHTPRDYAMKLARLKIPTAPDDIVTSGHAVVRELKRLGIERGDVVHVCGGEGLIRLLVAERFVPSSEETRDARAVVVGWNPKGTYDDIRRAANLVRSGLPFIASNLDATYPAEGQLLPGTGALVAAIEVASGRTCNAVGKPKPGLFELALERARAQPFQALFVGDRPETDVVGARAAGIASALVLTGVVGESSLGSIAAVPDVVIDDLADVMRDLPHPRMIRRNGEIVAMERTRVVGGSDVELASIHVSEDSTRILRDLHVDPKLSPDGAWKVVRRLLVEAVAGADRVHAAADVRRLAERIGVEVVADDAQGVLPGL